MKDQSNKLARVRSNFPHIEKHIIYLNHAAIGPFSRPVKEVMNAYVEERGGTNIENYPDLMAVMSDTLQCIGEIINAPAELVEFTPNTSYGLNVLAQGMPWQPGDRIIIPSCEFPANVHPFLDLRSQGVEVDFVPHTNGTFKLEDISRFVTNRTRMLSVSWVQFLSGFRCELEKLGGFCKDNNLLFCVDGIQGLGALQMDVKKAGIDFLSTGGHKWLLATQGVGFIYVSDQLLDILHPMIGWLNGPIDWDNLMEYKTDLHPDARRFRLGTLNGLGITALNASLNLYRTIGPAWCEKNLIRVTRHLRKGMDKLGFELYGATEEKHLSGISTFMHPESERLYEKLKENRIYAALRNKMLRFAPGYYTSIEDIDTALSVLADSL